MAAPGDATPVLGTCHFYAETDAHVQTGHDTTLFVAISREAIEKAFAVDGPSLIEFVVAKEEMVFPMVPAGAATGDMITQRFKDD